MPLLPLTCRGNGNGEKLAFVGMMAQVQKENVFEHDHLSFVALVYADKENLHVYDVLPASNSDTGNAGAATIVVDKALGANGLISPSKLLNPPKKYRTEAISAQVDVQEKLKKLPLTNKAGKGVTGAEVWYFACSGVASFP